jgi:glycosyltransferase involved in cell wall biosynthesis
MRKLITYDVVVTTTARSTYINNALISIARQTIQPTQCIIVINGSPTESLKVKIPSELTATCVKIYASDIMNANHARNIGVRLCRADVISILDDDDEWEVSRMQMILDRLSESDADIVYNDFFSGWSQNSRKIICASHKHLKNRNDVGGFSSVSLRRSVFVRVGELDASLKSCQDWDYWLRCLESGIKFERISAPLSFHRVSLSGSITRNSNAQYRGLRRLYFKHRLKLSYSIVKELYFRRKLSQIKRSPVGFWIFLDPIRYVKFLGLRFLYILYKFVIRFRVYRY